MCSFKKKEKFPQQFQLSEGESQTHKHVQSANKLTKPMAMWSLGLVWFQLAKHDQFTVKTQYSVEANLDVTLS
jgi:hypothetical protein